MADFKPKTFQPSTFQESPSNISANQSQLPDRPVPFPDEGTLLQQLSSPGFKSRNVGQEKAIPNIASNIAGTLPTIGAIAGSIKGPKGTTIGSAAGLSLENAINTAFGTLEDSPEEFGKKMVTQPPIAGVTDVVTLGMFKYGAPLVKNTIRGVFNKVVSKVAKSNIGKFIPKNSGSKIYKSSFVIPKRVQENGLNLDTMSQTMNDYGIWGSFDDLAVVANKVTGSDGIISKAMRSTLGRIKKPVDFDAAMAILRRDKVTSTNITDKIWERTKNDIVRMLSPARPTAIGKGSSLDAFDVVQALEKKGYNLINSSPPANPNPELIQQGGMYISASKELIKEINLGQVAEGSLDAVKTSSIFSKLRNISPGLSKKFSEVKNISELRSLAKPFVDLDQAISLTKINESSPWFKGRGTDPIGVGQLPTATFQAITNHSAFKTGMVQLFKKEFPDIPIEEISRAVNQVIVGAGASEIENQKELEEQKSLPEVPEELTPENAPFLRK